MTTMRSAMAFFTAAVIKGLQCGARTDERGFVTAETVAAFIDSDESGAEARQRIRSEVRGFADRAQRHGSTSRASRTETP